MLTTKKHHACTMTSMMFFGVFCFLFNFHTNPIHKEIAVVGQTEKFSVAKRLNGSLYCHRRWSESKLAFERRREVA